MTMANESNAKSTRGAQANNVTIQEVHSFLGTSSIRESRALAREITNDVNSLTLSEKTSKMPLFKDEHILLIAPGSRTTLAQLGIPESYTPARLRVPTRMFRSEVPGKYEPYKIREKIVKRTVQATTEPQNGAEGANNDAITTETQEDRVVYEEDMTSDEDAVYPIVKGRVYNWECFFALLEHIHNTLSPPFHTPVLFLMPSGWVPKEHEYLARFWFEKFKIPALVLMDACLATCWAYSTPSATVVDVGYDKTDVTTVTDFWPCPVSRLLSLPGPSGEAMTRRLEEMLGPKGFTHDMCEQLKKNPICEILPPGTALPSEAEAPESANPAAAASTGVNGNAAVGNAKPATVQNGLPRGPGPGTEIGVEQADDNEGVLDVASIVASGKTSEFLAKKEREKAERAAKRAAAAAADAAPKAAKLSNSQKANAVFHYDEPRKAEEGTNGEATVGDAAKENVTGKESAAEPPTNGEASVSADGPSNAPEPAPLSKKEEKKRIRESSGYVRKELEVGVERFKAGEEVIERVIDAIYTNIMGFPDPYERHKFWDSLILCGNGSKVKGFKDAVLARLNAKYLKSPSSATMFTSELPSNFSTPAPTGANTPIPQAQPTHHASGVNPLLLAATTAQNPALATPGGHLHPSSAAGGAYTPGSATPGGLKPLPREPPRQTPTSIRYAKLPEYFPEWKDHGPEEAHFLGAQIAAKVLFADKQLVPLGMNAPVEDQRRYMTRTDYNELGPSGIRDYVIA